MTQEELREKIAQKWWEIVTKTEVAKEMGND